MKAFLPPLTALLVVFFVGSLHGQTRKFTGTDGRSLQATPVKVTSTEAVFSRPKGSNVTVPLSRFIQADQDFLKTWAEEQKKNLIPKVEIRINSNKRDRREENAYEDRRGQFKFEIEIENEERNYDLKGAKATLVALGSYMYREGEGIVMEKTEFKNLDIPEGESIKLEGKLVQFEYDKNGFKHGEKYTGYLFQLRTSNGNIIETRGSTSRIEGAAETILKYKLDEHFDERTFRSLSGSNAVRR